MFTFLLFYLPLLAFILWLFWYRHGMPTLEGRRLALVISLAFSALIVAAALMWVFMPGTRFW